MSTDVSRTAPGVALKVIVASVFSDFLSMQAFLWVNAAVVRAAVSRIDAVVVERAKDFLGEGNKGGSLLESQMLLVQF